MKTAASRALYDRAIRLMPGGVNSPVRAFKSVGGDPVFMVRGSGPRMTDADGNEYIDYCMSWGPLILGHADPDVIASITDAARDGTSFGTATLREVLMAEELSSRFPSMEMLRCVSSGTEATMSAIRLARGHTGREAIIKFDGCYHGHADHLLVAAGSGLATFGTPDSAGVTSGAAGDTIVLPFNDLRAVEARMSTGGERIAAIIVEPVPCNYGLIPPAAGFLEGLRSLCDRHGTMLIFDEVITGLRLSRGGAQEYFGIRPDITTLGKIVGGGLPVGVYGASSLIMKSIAPEGPVYQAGTLSGNPLAMAAGLATMDKLDRIAAWNILAQKGKLFAEMIAERIEPYRGRVLFLSLESIFSFYFTQRESIESVDHVRSCDMKAFGTFHRLLREKGIYLSPSGFEVGFLSVTHENEDLKRTSAAVADALKEMFE